VGCYIWYSEKGPGRAAAPLSPLDVTAHPSTASKPITVLLYNGLLLYGFNVTIKGLSRAASAKRRLYAMMLCICLFVCLFVRLFVRLSSLPNSAATYFLSVQFMVAAGLTRGVHKRATLVSVAQNGKISHSNQL